MLLRKVSAADSLLQQSFGKKSGIERPLQKSIALESPNSDAEVGQQGIQQLAGSCGGSGNRCAWQMWRFSDGCMLNPAED